MKYNYLVRQDGADFYLYNGFDGLEVTITCPLKVRDFDLTKAEQARKWFIELMDKWDIIVYFPE